LERLLRKFKKLELMKDAIVFAIGFALGAWLF